MGFLLTSYLFSITIFYQYGIGSVRFFDIITLIVIFFCIKEILVEKKLEVDKKLLFFLPLILSESYFNLISITIDIENFLTFIRYFFIYLTPILLISLDKKRECKIKNYFLFLLIINVIYSAVQISVGNNLLNEKFLFTRNFNMILAESHLELFKWTSRVNGFFINSTQYSIFLSVYLYLLYDKAIKTKIDLKKSIIILLTIISIILTQSRLALLIAVLNTVCFFIFSKEKSKILIFSTFSLLIFKNYLSKYLFRVYRLFNQGESDYSAHTRLVLWKEILKKMDEYPFGTIEGAVKTLGLVDSGYLTYYIQGKWLMLIPIFVLISFLYFYSISTKNFFLFFLTNYLTVVMFFFNILHNFFIVFIIIYFITRKDRTENNNKNLDLLTGGA